MGIYSDAMRELTHVRDQFANANKTISDVGRSFDVSKIQVAIDGIPGRLESVAGALERASIEETEIELRSKSDAVGKEKSKKGEK